MNFTLNSFGGKMTQEAWASGGIKFACNVGVSSGVLWGSGLLSPRLIYPTLLYKAPVSDPRVAPSPVLPTNSIMHVR